MGGGEQGAWGTGEGRGYGASVGRTNPEVKFQSKICTLEKSGDNVGKATDFNKCVRNQEENSPDGDKLIRPSELLVCREVLIERDQSPACVYTTNCVPPTERAHITLLLRQSVVPDCSQEWGGGRNARIPHTHAHIHRRSTENFGRFAFPSG